MFKLFLREKCPRKYVATTSPNPPQVSFPLMTRNTCTRMRYSSTVKPCAAYSASAHIKGRDRDVRALGLQIPIIAEQRSPSSFSLISGTLLFFTMYMRRCKLQVVIALDLAPSSNDFGLWQPSVHRDVAFKSFNVGSSYNTESEIQYASNCSLWNLGCVWTAEGQASFTLVMKYCCNSSYPNERESIIHWVMSEHQVRTCWNATIILFPIGSPIQIDIRVQ